MVCDEHGTIFILLDTFNHHMLRVLTMLEVDQYTENKKNDTYTNSTGGDINHIHTKGLI